MDSFLEDTVSEALTGHRYLKIDTKGQAQTGDAFAQDSPNWGASHMHDGAAVENSAKVLLGSVWREKRFLGLLMTSPPPPCVSVSIRGGSYLICRAKRWTQGHWKGSGSRLGSGDDIDRAYQVEYWETIRTDYILSTMAGRAGWDGGLGPACDSELESW